jgi:hypothetical protein
MSAPQPSADRAAPRPVSLATPVAAPTLRFDARPATESTAARSFRAKLAERAGETKDDALREKSGGKEEAEPLFGGERPVRPDARAMLSSDDEGSAGNAFSAPAQLVSSAVAPVDQAAVAMGPEPAAVAAVERLASAVAAALTRNELPVFTINFNGASPIAQGALISREPGGAVSIRLEGVSPTGVLPPAALEAELRVMLDRRRVRMGRLEWGTPAGLRISTSASKRFAESSQRPRGA